VAAKRLHLVLRGCSFCRDRARSRTEGATKRGRTGHCCLLTLASAAILAGSGLFIAGAILQVCL